MSISTIIYIAVALVVGFFSGVFSARRSKTTNVLADQLQAQINRLEAKIDGLKDAAKNYEAPDGQTQYTKGGS